MPHQKKWVSIAATVSMLMALNAASVIAHSPGLEDDHDLCQHCQDKMSEMDTDGDGKISRREFMKYHGEAFDKHDLDDDRFLDADEIHWMMEDMHTQMQDGDHEHGHEHGHGNVHKHGHGHDDEHHEKEEGHSHGHNDDSHGH